MEADRIITIKEKVDLDIQQITLLLADEVSSLSESVLATESWWWLRSPGNNPSRVACVDNDGSVFTYGCNVNYGYGVRPALRINKLKHLGFNVGDKIEVGDESWTVISEDLALCDRIVGASAFRWASTAPDANVYEKSDIKMWLDQWTLEKGIVTQENIELFHTR